MRSTRRRDSFHDDSLVGRFVREPLRRLGDFLGRLVPERSDNIKGANKLSIGRILSGVAHGIFVAPFQFLISSWSTSREALPFMLGLPAVLTALAAVVPSLAFSVSQDRIRRSYDSLSARAINGNEHKLAELCTQKLLALVPDNREYYVRLASTIGQVKKDEDYAVELVKQVANSAAHQSVNANIFIAQSLVNKPDPLSEEDIQTAEHHIGMALDADPEHFTANSVAYHLYVKIGQPERAMERARILAHAEPFTSHLLLKQLKDLGLDKEFEHTLNDVLLNISEVAYRNPNEIRLWGQLVACCMLGDRYAEAIEYVQTGLRLCTNPTVRVQLTILASKVLIGWYDEIKTFTDKQKFQDSIRALNAALNLYIENSQAITRASELYLDPNLDSKRMDWVIETLAKDDNAYCTHMMIGWRALFIDKEKGVETARTHWKIAHTSAGIFSTILAQLSTTIAATESDKVTHALQAVDLALTIDPNNVDLGEARGLILMSAERWFEAKQQLDEILNETPRPYFVLKKLIECCVKLSDEVGEQEYKAQLELLPVEVKPVDLEGS